MISSVLKLLAIVCLSLAWLLPTRVTLAEEARVFKDWTVICELARQCVMQTSATGRTDAHTYTFDLQLRRKKSTGIRIDVAINFIDVIPGKSSPLILAVDDGPPFRFEEGAGYKLSGNSVRLIDRQLVDRLVEAMRKGDDLYVTFVSPKLRETGLAFSLSGVIASLLWMDEQ